MIQVIVIYYFRGTIAQWDLLTMTLHLPNFNAHSWNVKMALNMDKTHSNGNTTLLPTNTILLWNRKIRKKQIFLMVRHTYFQIDLRWWHRWSVTFYQILIYFEFNECPKNVCCFKNLCCRVRVQMFYMVLKFFTLWMLIMYCVCNQVLFFVLRW